MNKYLVTLKDGSAQLQTASSMEWSRTGFLRLEDDKGLVALYAVTEMRSVVRQQGD